MNPYTTAFDAPGRIGSAQICGNDACVDAARHGATVAIRSTLNPSVVLPVTVDEWTAFVEQVKAGKWDHVGAVPIAA